MSQSGIDRLAKAHKVEEGKAWEIWLLMDDVMDEEDYEEPEQLVEDVKRTMGNDDVPDEFYEDAAKLYFDEML